MRIRLYWIFFLLSLALFSLPWLFFPSAVKGLKVFTSLLLSISMIVLAWKENPEIESLFLKISNWSSSVFLLAVSIAYLFVSTGDVKIGAFIVLGTVVAFLIGVFILFLAALLKPKNLLAVVIGYVGISLILIPIFSFIYFNQFESGVGQIISSVNGASLKVPGDFTYFSGTVHFLSPIGDFYAVGSSRVWMLIQLGASYILHFIALAFAVYEAQKQTKN